MPWDRLERVRRKKNRICVGLISGTSADAAEAAICRIQGSGATVHLELLAHVSEQFEGPFRERILKADSARELSMLNFELGERFARAALKVIRAAGLRKEKVDLIGSHGQTFAHLPPSISQTPSTLQLGEASVIAAGGEGAPLVPYADWALFRKRGHRRALLNIGGIANVSVVSDRLEDTLAFDTGPGNMLLDALAKKVTEGRLACDLDGTLSRRGKVDRLLLRQLLKDPYLRRAPPKSTGRERYGVGVAEKLWASHRRRPYDLMATVVALTVESVGRAFDRWVARLGRINAIYVSGGGSRNPSLMEPLTLRLGPIPMRPLSDLGLPEGAKEAVCFALLGSECLSGTPQNVPSATGAKHSVILGKIIP
jgi:anhydro-N-acetylmuramic acid kinase